MFRKYVLIFIMLVQCLWVKSQNSYNSDKDSIAYMYNWLGMYNKTLIFCDSIISQKLGYQDLFYKAAYAAHALNKSMLEQRYLLMAAKQNPQDTFTTQLLFTNYLINNQYHQAARINQQLKKQQISFGLPAVHLLHTETGIKTSSNDTLYKPLYYQQIGVGARIGSVIIYNALSHLTQQAFFGTINQWQLYTLAQMALSNNWSITAAMHLLAFNTSDIPANISNNFRSEEPYAFSVNVSRIISNFTAALTTVHSRMNSNNQLQIQPQITWWPKYNNTMCLQTTLNYLTENNTLQMHMQATYRPVNALNIIAAYSYINAKNFTEQNAYIFNNSFDNTLNRFQFSATFDVPKGYTPYLFYQLETKEEFDYKIP